MKIIFKQLTLKNVKSHRDITVNFGERTDITAENAKGKSTIAEAITFLLYGVDMFGSKVDPTPITYEAEETKVSLLLNADGKDLLLTRSIKKGKAVYHINDVPSKATEFNELVGQLFEKDLFLSLFNPNFFFTQKWEKQRGMLLQYVTAPSNKEVLSKLPETQSKALSPLLKKHSLSDIEKIHREDKVSLDRKYITAQSRAETLNGQLEQFAPAAPMDSLKVERDQLLKEIKEVEKVTDSAGDNNSRINFLQNKIRILTDERDQMKDDFQRLKGEEITSHCRACKQPLQDDSVQVALEFKERKLAEFKENFNQVVNKRKEYEAELETLEYIDVSEQLEKVRAIQEKINSVEREIDRHKQYERLEEQFYQAANLEKEVLQDLNNSIFIIDSVKAFKAQEAQLQAEKVQALFDRLSVRLFETQKNGEIKNTFEIELDNKPYSKLSLSEGIRAGLELRDVLSEQSGVIVPCFIDNSESITSFKEPNGQLILARVVAGQELKIESK